MAFSLQRNGGTDGSCTRSSNSNKLEQTRTNSNKLEQTRTNSNKLEHPQKNRNKRQNPMDYEELSKSIELDQTLTPDFALRDDSRTEANEKSQSLRSWAHCGRMIGVELDRIASNSNELEHPQKNRNKRQNPMDYEEMSKSIELDQTLTPDFALRDDSRTEANEESQSLRSRAHCGRMIGVELDRIASNSNELERTRTPPKKQK
jgi:hypothetical protein